jgi:hypothetical protein
MDNKVYSSLKRIIYTYQYLSFLHASDLEIFKDLQNDNIYYLKSSKEILKLII